jgi:hypothetical protein
LNRRRSSSGIIRSKIDVNTWLARPPTVSEARPARCTCCGAASRPAGGKLAVHGHDVRARQVRRPPKPGHRPAIVVVDVRRYECQECGAVMTVVPGAVLAKMLYAATAIGMSLALYGIDGKSAREVREIVSAWTVICASSTGWKTLRRWIARASTLWTCIRDSPPSFTTRQRAERAASTLVAYAPSASAVEAAFTGAARAQ